MAPVIRRAAASLTDASTAPAAGGRTTFPYNMPGRMTSDTYFCVPFTIASLPTLATPLPATVHCAAALVGCVAGI